GVSALLQRVRGQRHADVDGRPERDPAARGDLGADARTDGSVDGARGHRVRVAGGGGRVGGEQAGGGGDAAERERDVDAGGDRAEQEERGGAGRDGGRGEIGPGLGRDREASGAEPPEDHRPQGGRGGGA